MSNAYMLYQLRMPYGIKRSVPVIIFSLRTGQCGRRLVYRDVVRKPGLDVIQSCGIKLELSWRIPKGIFAGKKLNEQVHRVANLCQCS
jgi:hypothetical protein